MKNRAPQLSEEQYASNFADIQNPLSGEQAAVESKVLRGLPVQRGLRASGGCGENLSKLTQVERILP